MPIGKDVLLQREGFVTNLVLKLDFYWLWSITNKYYESTTRPTSLRFYWLLLGIKGFEVKTEYVARLLNELHHFHFLNLNDWSLV